MRRPVRLRVNGDAHDLFVDTRQSLLEALRDGLHLTGAKEGCGNGNCGACTVIMDGRAVDSCLVLALEAEGHDITTIEGLARDGQLHPLQRAFIDIGGLECGFCTPGFIMSAKVLLDANSKPSEHEIRTAIAGNLCRCTGYDKIVRAIMAVAQS
ncbi:MAG: (2Fe-2S)-binding protein [Dehalococcoidia bacterium]